MHFVTRISAFFILFLLCACGTRQYPGLPTLPTKDWLQTEKKEEQPKQEKFDIYSPDKTLGIDDLVWLAIQQSPEISQGRINLEIREISKTDAKWNYLPEVHLMYHITNNMTKYNEGSRYARNNYGETTYEVTFSGRYNNPVATYLTVKAQEELLQTAIIAQRKLIGEIIFKIANCLIELEGLEKNIALVSRQMEQADKRLKRQEITSRFSSGVLSSTNSLISGALSVEMLLRELKMQQTVTRSLLKQLVGLDINQALKVDTASVTRLLDNFHPEKMDWKTAWQNTEARYMANQQVKLENANVYLAWASYLPSINLAVNESPGKGQAQPYDGEPDQFVHLYFDFPILDWGHRWRTADMAGLRGKQRQLDAIQQEREYKRQWEIMEQGLLLARAKVDRWTEAANNANRINKALEISAEKGLLPQYMLGENIQKEISDRLSAENAMTDEKKGKLTWIHFASGLTNHYLGNAGLTRE